MIESLLMFGKMQNFLSQTALVERKAVGQLFLFGAATLLALAVIPLAALADIKIATVGPMTGMYKPFGQQMRHGAQMAVDEINASGGINGERLILTIGDDRCDPLKAKHVAEEMASAKVVLVVGHFCSGSSIPASRVYDREGIIQISPASTNPVFTRKRPGPGIFRTIPSDDRHGKLVGEYLASEYKGRRIAIIRQDTAYGWVLTIAARQALDEAGQAVTFSGSFSDGQKDFANLVTSLKFEAVEVVYAAGYYEEVGRLAREMRKQGLNAKLIGADALNTLKFWEVAGRAAEGTLMTQLADSRDIPAATAIVKKFRAKKIEPDGYTLNSYVAVRIWADAATSIGSTKFAEVVKALQKIDSNTAIGRVRFDKHGDLRDPELVWYIWHEGQYMPTELAAMAAHKRGDYATALELFRLSAEQGNALAQFMLGGMYDNSQGVPQDYIEAANWYRKAADQGNAEAQTNLGLMYTEGHGVLQSYIEAANWYRKAADQGEALAQNYLGVAYANGWGVPQDYAEAANWYRKAADQGQALAQSNLGVAYMNGEGVLQDYVQAHMWLSLAVSSSSNSDDHGQAVKNRDIVANKMTPVQIAKAKRLAREWKKAHPQQ